MTVTILNSHITRNVVKNYVMILSYLVLAGIPINVASQVI